MSSLTRLCALISIGLACVACGRLPEPDAETQWRDAISRQSLATPPSLNLRPPGAVLTSAARGG